jgi:type I restriction enzyme S subunit
MTRWPRVQLRRIAHLAYGDSLADSERLDGLVPVYGSNGKVGVHDRANTSAPVLIVGRKGSFGKVQFSDEKVFAIDTTFYIDASQSRADLRWLYYAISTLGLDSLSEDVGVPGLSRERAYAQRLPLPKPDEQRAMANCLDTETARIDALIEKKRRLVALLEERVHSTTVAVVLGDFGQQGSPSRSGFFRVAPASWSETSLRHLDCEVQTGPFGSQLHSGEYVEGGWPVVNPMNLVDGSILAVETMTVTDNKRAELARHILRIGDIVFGRRGEMGRAGLVDDRSEGWLCGTGSLRLRLRGTRLLPEYLKLLLETAPLRAYFELSSVGSTMDNLNSEILLACPVLVPELIQQRLIITEVESTQRSHRAAQAALRQQIDLLVEHRQALITAAVTGELDIPGVAA